MEKQVEGSIFWTAFFHDGLVALLQCARAPAQGQLCIKFCRLFSEDLNFSSPFSGLRCKGSQSRQVHQTAATATEGPKSEGWGRVGRYTSWFHLAGLAFLVWRDLVEIEGSRLSVHCSLATRNYLPCISSMFPLFDAVSRTFADLTSPWQNARVHATDASVDSSKLSLPPALLPRSHIFETQPSPLQQHLPLYDSLNLFLPRPNFRQLPTSNASFFIKHELWCSCRYIAAYSRLLVSCFAAKKSPKATNSARSPF